MICRVTKFTNDVGTTASRGSTFITLRSAIVAGPVGDTIAPARKMSQRTASAAAAGSFSASKSVASRTTTAKPPRLAVTSTAAASMTQYLRRSLSYARPRGRGVVAAGLRGTRSRPRRRRDS